MKKKYSTLADADAHGEVAPFESFIDYINKGHAEGFLTDRQKQQMLSGISRFLSQPQGCYLCHGKPKFFSVLFPTEAFAKQIGQPENKSRIVLYSLCAKCAEIADVHERVEDKIEFEMGSRAP